MSSDEKVFLALFYPWSNEDSSAYLKQVELDCGTREDIYFKRCTIIKSLEDRPVELVTLSSKRGVSPREENIDDSNLFPEKDKPKAFTDKKCIIIGARVHPGEVPGSHVLTGIINELISQSTIARLLLDKFVFYFFPIFNPDGVARGHYRVDTNGINLNRCYINPNPKLHAPIYAVKKLLLHFHQQEKYFAFLDLHAHAARKGVFIYGNCSNELLKQVDTCLFPKILSLNSENFDY